MERTLRRPALFPAIEMRARRISGRDCVWDRIRGMWLVLTPEEWVRQHVSHFLNVTLGIEAERIAMEYPVPINGQAQRADIVLLGRFSRPMVLIECKEQGIKLSETRNLESVFGQAARYNTVVRAPRILITNGDEAYSAVTDDWKSYRPYADPLRFPETDADSE